MPFKIKNLKNISKYIKEKLLGINDTPHAIALGAAFGISIAMSPFFGLQIFITLFCDFIFRANIAASLITSVIGNPLTFPFIWIGSYKLGNLILKAEGEIITQKNDFIQTLTSLKDGVLNGNWPIIKEDVISIMLPMTIGGVILATIFGVLTYITTLILIKKTRS